MNAEESEVKEEHAEPSLAEIMVVLFYFVAFILLCSVRWEIGVAWLLWRIASSLRKSLEK